MLRSTKATVAGESSLQLTVSSMPMLHGTGRDWGAAGWSAVDASDDELFDVTSSRREGDMSA